MRPSRRLSAAAPILAGALLSACSILNAPDDVNPGGDGGAGPGPTGTTSGGGDATTTASTGGDGGGPPECEGPADCDATECESAACEAGRCVVEPLASGTACGPGAAECQAGGACDGSGACVVADLEGASCASCDGDPAACVCRGGACTTCDVLASRELFATADLPGWELTGGWGLYTRFPRDRQAPAEVPIGKRVLGTDGNRSRPYPGGEDAAVGGSIEQSSATSPVTTLPATLTFRSWHEDEGGAPTGRDNKRIVALVDDVEHVIVDCAAGVAAVLPFCQPPPGGLAAQRAADAWDEIAIPMPDDVAGEEGRLRFEYDSVDAAGGRERGWFVDALGVAARCGCSADAECAFLGGPCSEGVCDEGACTIAPRAGSEGGACGSADADACGAADRCDAFGLCDPANRLDGTACNDCDGGDCQVCGAGACVTCEADVQGFDGLLPTAGWELLGGWGVYAAAPAGATLPLVPFPSAMFGTPGAPEAAFATTIETVIPEVLEFSSWHVDDATAETGTSNKTISAVVDGEPIALLDCQDGVGADLAPCLLRPGPRAGGDRDQVTIATGAAAGRIGKLVFTFSTGGPGAQGWFIDDLNAVRCP